MIFLILEDRVKYGVPGKGVPGDFAVAAD